MPKTSAGILLYRFKDSNPEVLLVHPGGPFWAKKDSGAWSIPKGEFTGETPIEAAKREFREETGENITGDFIALTPVRLKSGKIIYAFTREQDFDEQNIKSNSFSMEWPPKSKKVVDFPEIDRACWFDLNTAHEKINVGQAAIIDKLKDLLMR